MDNQKIARWAGFHYSPDNVWVEDHDEPYEDGWLYPDGSWHRSLPNFPKNLNACEKWIWPKLDSIDLFISKGKTTVTIRKGEPLEASSWHIGEHTIPATAICLAIENLIEGVK